MKRLLVFSIAIVTVGVAPAFADVDPKIHKLCVEAKDYLGCVKAMNGKDTKEEPPSNAEKCWGDGTERTCLAKEGIDNLGMPKIVNWLYRYTPEGNVWYEEASLKKIEETGKPVYKGFHIIHKGERERYIGNRQVYRKLMKPQRGYSGSTSTIGTSSTSCSSYGGQTYCTSTPAPTISIPGYSGMPAYVDVASGMAVVDCKEGTIGVYIKEGEGRGWRKFPQWEKTCAGIQWDELEVLDFKL